MGRVPGYLGDTDYWFGLAGSQFGSRGSRRRRRRRAEQQQQMQEQMQKMRQLPARRPPEAALLRQQQQQSGFGKNLRLPPRPARTPPPKPKIPTLTPPFQAKAAAMPPPVATEVFSTASPVEMQPEPAAGDGAEYTPSSGGEESLTPEQMEEQRATQAATVAEELAGKYPKRKAKVFPKVEAVASFPQEPILPKRKGLFGPLLDALFGPPPS